MQYNQQLNNHMHVLTVTYAKKEVTTKETVLKSESDQIARCLLDIPLLYEEGCRYKKIDLLIRAL